MDKRYEHLPLNLIPNSYLLKNNSSKFNPFKPSKRNKTDFYTVQLKNINSIKENHKTLTNKYEKYFYPENIFKITLTQSVSEEVFRNALYTCGIETIAASPDMYGFWVVNSQDLDLNKLKEKLGKYLQLEDGKTNFIDVISDMDVIPPHEKIGEFLKERPFAEDEIAYLDVELWRMPDDVLEQFLRKLQKYVDDHGGIIEDSMTTDHFCLLRIFSNKQLLKDLLEMREVSNVNRPLKLKVEDSFNIDIKELSYDRAPPKTAPEILIVDSGLIRHPLLENSIGTVIAVSTKDKKIQEDVPFDDVGHGTQVGSVAVYGDLKKCLEGKSFEPKAIIHSAKVMYRNQDGDAEFNEKELLEHLLQQAVERIIDIHNNCKIINLSFGNEAYRMFRGKRQFRLASLVDELSEKHKLIFVISAGNVNYNSEINYPDCFLEDSDFRKIIDPASSILGLTVGSVYSRQTGQNIELDFPSPRSRLGPGFQGMIKPELVENGGGGYGQETDVVVLEPDRNKGRLFSLTFGTSFSSAKIAHYLARIYEKYPDSSINLVKALLLSSTSIPNERPGLLRDIALEGKTEDLVKLLNIYGYGKPNLDESLYSFDNRLLFVHDGSISSRTIHLFQISLSPEFVNESGEKTISVTLVYTPKIRRRKTNYLEVNMEFHLFKNLTVDEIYQKYSRFQLDESDNSVPEDLRNFELKLLPGVNLRKKGVHQKGSVTYKRTPQINADIPLILAVICQGKKDEMLNQEYSVVVKLSHKQDLELYNAIRLANSIQLKV